MSTAKADYEMALSQVAQDKIKLQNTYLYAPFSGQVGAHSANVGDYVNAGQTLTNIINLQNLQIIYTLPARYAEQVKLGQAVKISTHIEHPVTLMGEVSYVAPTIDTDSGCSNE